MRHRTALLTLGALALASCGDPKPAAPSRPIVGAPIEGAPIDAPAVPAAPTPAPATTVATTEPAAKPAAEPTIGDIGTGVTPPPAEPVVTTPPEPSPATPPQSAPAADPVAPSPPTATESVPALPPTTASQADKPVLPDRPTPAAQDTKAAAAPAGKGFIPKGHKKGEVIELTFEQLASFDFTPPPLPPLDSDAPPPDPAIALEAVRKQIPAEIWELEGETVSVEGYMIPLEYADEGVKAFLISRHAMGCCFGIMPRAHELVECDLGEGKSTPYVGYLPVKITGVFHVGPKEGAPTVLSGIYRMDAPKVTIPKEQ